MTPATTAQLQQSLSQATSHVWPFQHWTLAHVLPADIAQQCLNTPMADHPGVRYDGTRAGNSQQTPGGHPPERLFVDTQTCQKHPHFKHIAEAFLTRNLCAQLHRMGVIVEKRYLRIEYIVDRHGFYLEPHKDIGEKTLTLQIYLGDAPTHCGTDIYDRDLNHVKTLDFRHNHGYCFIPNDHSWHGLEAKKIPKERCSLIINYVSFVTDWPVPYTHAELMTQEEAMA